MVTCGVVGVEDDDVMVGGDDAQSYTLVAQETLESLAPCLRLDTLANSRMPGRTTGASPAEPMTPRTPRVPSTPRFHMGETVLRAQMPLLSHMQHRSGVMVSPPHAYRRV